MVTRMKIFSTDSPLYRFFSRLWDIIVLNFMWALFCLPVITAGASTIAAYSVALKMVDDEEGYIARSFIKAFKENLKQGIALGLITFAAGYVVYIDIAMFHAIESNPLPLLIVGVFAGVYFLFSLLYAYPLAARYQNTVFKILRNSLEISLRYIVRTLILLVLIAVAVAIIMWNEKTIVFGLLIGPAFIIFMIAAFAKRIFQKIERDQESE